ncbi:unnamed protein product [Sphenostylis stenocarpa]|uniref:Uncharacterized protein n=1 Tax=Sphenostylis stenocarpa TaxID=92480 RepID=A0AA86RQC5_9FABA|nr:unnamed protein product [Sphenostylis stenocarpa]
MEHRVASSVQDIPIVEICTVETVLKATHVSLNPNAPHPPSPTKEAQGPSTGITQYGEQPELEPHGARGAYEIALWAGPARSKISITTYMSLLETINYFCFKIFIAFQLIPASDTEDGASHACGPRLN